MKKYINVTIIASCILAFSTSLLAQSTVGSHFSIGAELAMPTATYGDQATTGFGGSLRYEIPVGTNLGLMATAGYLSFGSKSHDDASLSTYEYTNSSIPIQLGLKYYFGEQQYSFYIDMEGGVHLLSSENTVEHLGITTSNSYNKTAFSYAPGIGYHFARIDLGVKYQLFSESTTITNPINHESTTTSSTGSYLGIRAAFVF